MCRPPQHGARPARDRPRRRTQPGTAMIDLVDSPVHRYSSGRSDRRRGRCVVSPDEPLPDGLDEPRLTDGSVSGHQWDCQSGGRRHNEPVPRVRENVSRDRGIGVGDDNVHRSQFHRRRAGQSIPQMGQGGGGHPLGGLGDVLQVHQRGDGDDDAVGGLGLAEGSPSGRGEPGRSLDVPDDGMGVGDDPHADVRSRRASSLPRSKSSHARSGKSGNDPANRSACPTGPASTTRRWAPGRRPSNAS